MPSISFFEEGITYKLKYKTALRQWISKTILAEGFKLKELTYIFCSDNYLLQINQQYLNHDTYTDTITFDNSDIEKVIIGDIFISVERIRENAAKFNIAETDELHRVIIHGALHLLGYKDKNAPDKEKMTLKEDFYLNKRSFNS
jgi:probable rRNA maturation factor